MAGVIKLGIDVVVGYCCCGAICWAPGDKEWLDAWSVMEVGSGAPGVVTFSDVAREAEPRREPGCEGVPNEVFQCLVYASARKSRWHQIGA